MADYNFDKSMPMNWYGAAVSLCHFKVSLILQNEYYILKLTNTHTYIQLKWLLLFMSRLSSRSRVNLDRKLYQNDPNGLPNKVDSATSDRFQVVLHVCSVERSICQRSRSYWVI